MFLTKKDEAGVILSNEQNDFLIVDATKMGEIEELSMNLCMMVRIQPANINSDEGPSYDSVFISELIQNGNGPIIVTTDTNRIIKVLPPKEVVARERERKARTTLLMALLKEMWEAIKSRFSGNDESKKMQKYLLKEQFKGFSVSALEVLHKGYDIFQTILSQLEIHGAGVSHEDANQKFLWSLPSSWSRVALIMRTKPGLDTLNFDDLYNNLRVFERGVKGTIASSSNTQNVAFVFANNTSSTNDFDTKDPVGFDKTKVECFNCHKMGHFARDYRAKGNQDSRRRDVGYNGNKTRYNDRRPTYLDDSKALVTIDGEDIDWFGHVEEDTQNYAMMAYSSSNSGSGNEASDLEDTPVNDRYADGTHAVPPPITGTYMPFGLDVEIDYSKFTYGPKQTSADELDSKPSEYAFCASDSSVETYTSMNETVENASKVVCEPKVWTDAPIIEEENVKETGTTNHSPKIEKRDRNGHTRQGLGYAFTRKACFVCGSFSHLIRDCDFHEKRMAKHAALTKSKNKDNLQALKDKGIVDSGCSRNITGNKAHLADYQEFNCGSVAFGGSNERITSEGKIKAGRLDFEDVYYVEELKHYNLFSVSQMCDKKNKGIKDVGYGIRDTWIDPVEAVPAITPTTVEEVNTKVVELAELHEHDIQDFHALLEDAKDGRSRISQRVDKNSQQVDLLMEDMMTLQETVQLIETLRVIRDMRRKMSDMQIELISQREQQIMVRTRRGQTPPPANPSNTNNMTPEAMQTMIDQALLRNSGDRDGSHSSHAENPKNMHTARPCYYADFMKCHPLNFKGTEGAVGLTR
nr:ribonuclease H-like domain-containing protein [Tanacetum cinerariifolium]